jgi:ATP-dependent DNA ligase
MPARRPALLKPPVEPLEARTAQHVPTGDGWQYEPKWDGFRCLAFRDSKAVHLQSKSGQPLGRYFPELVAALEQVEARRFVLDGEIVVPIDGRLSFDDLLQRIHPAASRVRTLAAKTPCAFIVFDLLADPEDPLLYTRPLRERRPRLEAFTERFLLADILRLSPATPSLQKARAWFKQTGGDLDGIIAKRLNAPYIAGGRDAMVKVKHRRTADCVVGGFRFATGRDTVGSLLLGLYDADGVLHHVGFTSSFKQSDRAAIDARLRPLRDGAGFTGRAPGGPSRWSTKRSTEWQPLTPSLVVEVEYDHFTGGRFRHGTKLLRWRPDKAPRQCTFEQVASEGSPLERLSAPARRTRGRSSRPVQSAGPAPARTKAKPRAARRTRRA